MAYSAPRWLQDLRRFLPLKSQFVVTGNVRDLQATELAPGAVTSLRFDQTLANALFAHGYRQVFHFDQLRGFQPMSPTVPSAQEVPSDGLLEAPATSGAPAGVDALSGLMPRLVRHERAPAALVIDFASRLTVSSDNLTSAEYLLFTQAFILSHEARPRPVEGQTKSFFNTVIWIVEREGDLPDWLVVDNPRIRVIAVAKPDHVVRRALAPALLQIVPGFRESSLEDRATAANEFVESTEGLLLHDLNAIATLGKAEGVQAANMADAVRRYKVGVTEDPWQRIDRTKIKGAEDLVRRRVKGQPLAVTHMLDLVKRAMTGVGGKRGNRPRGVAFLAGPTGVGKTELAKTITSLLFGDESAYVRFDMS